VEKALMQVPPEFAQTIHDIYGERGRLWLEQLPDLISQCEKRWSIRILSPYPLSYNYVAPALGADGSTMVFKAGVPNPELNNEMEALRLHDGRGIVRLFASDR
jgi:streptomycin 6-kinase